MDHDYHFVLPVDLKEYIINFASFNDMNLSETVIYIFNFMKPLLKKHYLKDMGCKIGKYRKIDADCDMHVYFDKKDYKFLRQVQANLYIFSMALIVRWLLDEFFKGLIRYGLDEFYKIVCRFNKIYINKNKKKWVKPISKHMLFQLDRNEYIRAVYNKEYDLLSLEFT